MSVYTKLLEMQKKVVGLGKDTKSFGYQYVSGGKVLENLKPIMNEVGLILKQEIVNVEKERIDYSAKAGSKSEMWYGVSFKFTWIDVETGEKDENMFYASGMNDWEKGLGSALTYAERYFLLKFFHINTDEDDIDNPNRKKDDSQQQKTIEVSVDSRQHVEVFNRNGMIEKINSMSPDEKQEIFNKYHELNGKIVKDAKFLTTDFLKKVYNKEI